MPARVLVAVAALAGVLPVAPAAAAPTCAERAALQLRYDLQVEAGLTAQHTREWSSAPRDRFGTATATYACQRAEGAAATGRAVGRFLSACAGRR